MTIRQKADEVIRQAGISGKAGRMYGRGLYKMGVRDIAAGLQRTCGWVVSPAAIASVYTEKELYRIGIGTYKVPK